MRVFGSALATILLLVSLGATEDRLDPAIGAQNAALYRSIQDAKDWRNPFIVVKDDGVDVRAEGIEGINGYQRVPVAELSRFLVRLPVSAWPYGRVIALENQHILPVPWDQYVRAMADTRQRVITVLTGLDIAVDPWP